ncbi:MAG: hypothetical protein ACE5EZ_04535 [Thermodesulfobacteriota bacterium]
MDSSGESTAWRGRQGQWGGYGGLFPTPPQMTCSKTEVAAEGAEGAGKTAMTFI